MNSDLFHLRPIKAPRLDEAGLRKTVSRLEKLTEGMESAGADSSPDLLEDLRNRMKVGFPKGRTFAECTAVKRREWLLLSLYLNDLNSPDAQAWLPSLDQNTAESILGKDPKLLKPHLRRLATQLYFTHYGRDRLPCLESLCWMLELAWRSASPETLDPVSKVWAENARVLFAVDAPDQVAATWRSGTAVHELADSYGIHEGGLFRERLLEALILNRVRKMPLADKDAELCDQVFAEKERVLATGLRLGAASVQILVKRSQEENHSAVPEDWSEQLVTFACDPRVPNSELQSKWWGWATTSEKDLAIRALSKLSLQAFIKLLEQSLRGTNAEHQFPARSELLLNLFKIGKVIDARLVVHRDLNHRLDARTRNILQPSWVGGGPQHTSFICLRCTDDVFLIEGTHSFALRGFLGSHSFPVKKFWDTPPQGHHDSAFRVLESQCSIYQRHHTGDWVWDFVSQLRSRHIEWRGLT
jgi:hypothetical protein